MSCRRRFSAIRMFCSYMTVVDIRAGGGACHDGLGLDRWFGVKHWRYLVRVFVDRSLYV